MAGLLATFAAGRLIGMVESRDWVSSPDPGSSSPCSSPQMPVGSASFLSSSSQALAYPGAQDGFGMPAVDEAATPGIHGAETTPSDLPEDDGTALPHEDEGTAWLEDDGAALLEDDGTALLEDDGKASLPASSAASSPAEVDIAEAGRFMHEAGLLTTCTGLRKALGTSVSAMLSGLLATAKPKGPSSNGYEVTVPSACVLMSALRCMSTYSEGFTCAVGGGLLATRRHLLAASSC